MASTHKKVVVRKFDRDSLNGFVASNNFVSEGKLQILNTAGNVVLIELREVKGVYFVREFGDSESLTRKTFTTRPRTEGLWATYKVVKNLIAEPIPLGYSLVGTVIATGSGVSGIDIGDRVACAESEAIHRSAWRG